MRKFGKFLVAILALGLIVLGLSKDDLFSESPNDTPPAASSTQGLPDNGTSGGESSSTETSEQEDSPDEVARPEEKDGTLDPCTILDKTNLSTVLGKKFSNDGEESTDIFYVGNNERRCDFTADSGELVMVSVIPNELIDGKTTVADAIVSEANGDDKPMDTLQHASFLGGSNFVLQRDGLAVWVRPDTSVTPAQAEQLAVMLDANLQGLADRKSTEN